MALLAADGLLCVKSADLGAHISPVTRNVLDSRPKGALGGGGLCPEAAILPLAFTGAPGLQPRRARALVLLANQMMGQVTARLPKQAYHVSAPFPALPCPSL